ncbi:heterokaryon incompatibility protein-domain-containing protein [Cercophora newfieldiana]|uniref:Heterokaryon incompatibility protein-domain-containing protein n=1 Tax=Cercophora newfieldiana TaxID=92897 RepID=A0AA39Y3U6_9PEZI|nr:heterokaryon incompatibility protein-domain-containing protein [Cercophora newfieldiana]
MKTEGNVGDTKCFIPQSRNDPGPMLGLSQSPRREIMDSPFPVEAGSSRLPREVKPSRLPGKVGPPSRVTVTSSDPEGITVATDAAQRNGGWSLCRGPCSHKSKSISSYRAYSRSSYSKYMDQDYLHLTRSWEPHKRCLSGLWTRDPRSDKSEIDRSGRGAACRWVLDSETFQQFLQDSSSRLLWIQTKSPEDNLSCVIDEVSKRAAPGSAVAYSFCPGQERRRKGEEDEVVLAGLVYLLVDAFPFLAAWVWKEKPDLYLERQPIDYQLRILKRILRHPELPTVFLIIDDLGGTAPGWEKDLLDFILESAASGRARWIISSRFSLAYKDVEIMLGRYAELKVLEKRLRLGHDAQLMDTSGLETLRWLRCILGPPAAGEPVLDSMTAPLESTDQTAHPPDRGKGIEPDSSGVPELESKIGSVDLKTYKPIYEELVPYDEFRTVLLWGGREADGIKCTIHRECIHHPSQFEALSYEWRLPDSPDPTAMRSITVNDENFLVGENLWNALRHLRPRGRGESRCLWIDAICIQQNNDRDRNVQVVIMPLIYSNATTVISWLGTTVSDVVKSSMVFLREFTTAGTQKIAKERADKRPDYAKMLIGMAKSQLPHTVSEAVLASFQTRRREWLDLRTFFSLRYWKRLWIAQEVVLARQLQFRCEDCAVDWPTIAFFLRYLRSVDGKAPKHILDLGRSPASAILSYRLDLQSLPNRDFPPLRETLTTFANSRCSDPRDHVYGLLGITAGDTTVHPDYSKSTLGLYESVIRDPRIRAEDQLVSFSQLLQRAMGGLFHPGPSPVSNADMNLSNDELQRPGTFYTRAKICGNISLVGDAYTTAEKARELLIEWHSLYFHRVRNHRPGDELPSETKHALLSIQKNAWKAISFNSCLSYAYVGGPRTQKPPWDQLLRRYEDETVTTSPTPGEPETPNPEQPTSCPGSTTPGELCPCLRTERLDLPPKWIIGTRGQIGLAPGAAQEGDIICHFENSDVAAIVRPFADGLFHAVVGRALILRQWDEEAVRVHGSSAEVFAYSTGGEGSGEGAL